MSEERWEKQRQSTGQPGPSNLPKSVGWIALVIALLAVAYLAGWYRKNHRLDDFAKCIAYKQARMYGLYWCPHCADQKAMFGASFHYIPYVECAVKGSPHELTPECKAAGVRLFPSWQFGSDAPKEGVLTLDQLSYKTGCPLQ